jgi:hypothetical protein
MRYSLLGTINRVPITGSDRSVRNAVNDLASKTENKTLFTNGQ